MFTHLHVLKSSKMASYDHCLVCLKANYGNENLRSKRKRAGTQQLVGTLRKCDTEIDDPHLLFSFLIFDLLEISKDNCVRLMSLMGNVEIGKLLVFCDNCKGMVDNAFKAHLQILELKQLVACWRQGVKQNLKEGLKLPEVHDLTGVYKKIWEIYQGKNIIKDNLQVTVSKSTVHIKVEPDDPGLRNDVDVSSNNDLDGDWEPEPGTDARDSDGSNDNATNSDESDFEPPPSSPIDNENSNDANDESYDYDNHPIPDDNDKESLICRICNFRSYHARGLKQHLTFHKIRKKTACTVCKYPCASMQHLYNHYKLKHPSLPTQGIKPLRKCHLLSLARNKNRAECHICHRMYLKSRIKEHVLSHEKNITCEICNFKLKSEKALLCHYSWKHPEENPTKIQHNYNWKCTECDYVAASESQKILHVRMHRLMDHVTQSEDQFTCNFCSESYPTRKNICRHMRLNHKPQINAARLTCTICSQLFTSSPLLKRHLAMDHEIKHYVCDQCGQKFRWESQLANHVAIHADAKFYCELCGLDFRTSYSLNLHKYRYHNDNPKKNKKAAAKTDVGEGAKSDECAKTEVKNDVTPEPETTSKSRYTNCQVCGIQCCNYRAVLKHLREEHSELYRFACSQCDKSFTQVYKLNEHTKQSHGEKEKCPHCDKEFKNYKTVRYHLRRKFCTKLPIENNSHDNPN